MTPHKSGPRAQWFSPLSHGEKTQSFVNELNSQDFVIAVERPSASWIIIPNKPFFWPSEAAKILGVSKMTIYRWIEAGTLPTHLTIKPYKIRREVLVKLLSPESHE